MCIERSADERKNIIENVPLMADIFHYALKGLEVPYIYGRLAKGITLEESRPVVVKFVRRLLGMIQNSY